jgi:signal transduction histidine kinase
MEQTTPDLTLPCLIHDLNNVFQTLIEAADLLSHDPRWAPVSAAMLRSIDRGREITLSLQATDQPSAPLETVLGNAQTFVEDSLIVGRGPVVQFTSEVEPGLVLRESWAWERVLINLFSNAVRAMPEGGTISTRARRLHGCIQIVVADEGSGIPPELISSLFQPDVSTKSAGGLGLHIVQTIVRQQDGEVTAANRPGLGAEFTICIPAEPVQTRIAKA